MCGLVCCFSLGLKAQDSTLVLPIDTTAIATDTTATVSDSTMSVGVNSPLKNKFRLKKDSVIVTPKVTLKKVKRSAKDEQKGTVRIIQDERINTLDRITKSDPYKHDGFRIQVIFGSQSLVNGKKSSFQNKYSYPAYVDFLAPNFRLRVGDFPTKQLAEKHLYRIRKSFPNAYIVKAKINIPSDFR